MTTMTLVDNNHNGYQDQQEKQKLIPEAWADTFPGPNGQIAFVSDSDIFVMNATDGSEQTNLRDNGDARSPHWRTNTSPGGSIDNG